MQHMSFNHVWGRVNTGLQSILASLTPQTAAARQTGVRLHRAGSSRGGLGRLAGYYHRCAEGWG
jgi:hypothetical protein